MAPERLRWTRKWLAMAARSKIDEKGVGNLMNLLRKALNGVLHLFGGRLPPEDDPYSYVMAPKKPRPPYRSAAAVADPPE
jgi:hypothetical protein